LDCWLAGWQVGWLAGLLLSRIECLKKRMSKSCRFYTFGSNLVLNVIQARPIWGAGWLAVAGCDWLAGWPWLAAWL